MPRNFDHLLQRVEFIVVASMRPRQMPRNFGRVSIALAYAAFASMRPRQMPRNFNVSALSATPPMMLP